MITPARSGAGYEALHGKLEPARQLAPAVGVARHRALAEPERLGGRRARQPELLQRVIELLCGHQSRLCHRRQRQATFPRKNCVRDPCKKAGETRNESGAKVAQLLVWPSPGTRRMAVGWKGQTRLHGRLQ